MKILLTTIIDNVNYGTYLQAYATVKLLEDRGCEVCVLNYIRPHLTHGHMLTMAKAGGLKSYLRGLVRVILDKYMKQNLKKFILSKAHITRSFTDWQSFRKSLTKYDLYMVGSDQVWNTIHNHGVDRVFFFEGINGKKVAYASSIGIESFQKQDQSKIRNLLADFSKITVRESFGISALNYLGIENVTQVLDPTLMLTKKDWQIINKKKFNKTEPYLLIYSVEKKRDNDTIEIARKIASKRGLKIYLISPYVKFRSKLNVDRVFSLADTNTFLSLFLGADYAVVNSFHGTAFAVNFGCQFVTVAPERFSTRVESLLKLLHLESRYISNIEEIPNEEIDYIEVSKKLNEQRELSGTTLDKLLTK